jgi:glycosyltransferase involved in cell wall biosynthesis
MGAVRLKLLMPILYRRSNQIVTVSNGIANELKEKMKGIESRTSVIHNGFDVNQLTLLSTEPVDEDTLRIFNSFKVLVTHCRLSRQKNLEGLLTVYSRIDYQNTKLVIIGDGELREKLIQLTRQLGLSVWSTWDNVKVDATYNVYFMGQQANPFKYLRLASVYIMTSGWEGFPLALCEAMACGLPVITADCFTGPREIIANEIALAQQPITEPCSTQYGVLMPLLDISSSQNIEMWSHEVTRLLHQRVSNLSQNHPGIDRIRQFQLSETLKQTANLINKVLE